MVRRQRIRFRPQVVPLPPLRCIHRRRLCIIHSPVRTVARPCRLLFQLHHSLPLPLLKIVAILLYQAFQIQLYQFLVLTIIQGLRPLLALLHPLTDPPLLLLLQVLPRAILVILPFLALFHFHLWDKHLTSH
jgi:hypothetical protein